MKKLVLILIVFALFSLACDLALPPSPGGGSLPDAGGNNNPGNLNTPSSSNPGEGINTALPPTSFAPAEGTPLGDSPGPGTPTVPRLTDVPGTAPVFTPTSNSTPAATATP